MVCACVLGGGGGKRGCTECNDLSPCRVLFMLAAITRCTLPCVANYDGMPAEALSSTRTGSRAPFPTRCRAFDPPYSAYPCCPAPSQSVVAAGVHATQVVTLLPFWASGVFMDVQGPCVDGQCNARVASRSPVSSHRPPVSLQPPLTGLTHSAVHFLGLCSTFMPMLRLA